jgi:hypothetical protein
MESVAAAAPQLQLYLFKSATNQRMFCHYGGMRRPIDEDKLAKNWSWADEVGILNMYIWQCRWDVAKSSRQDVTADAESAFAAKNWSWANEVR